MKIIRSSGRGVILVAFPLSLAAQSGPPSQRELNGFLIGQHSSAVAASFAEVLQVDTTPDGWVYRSYLIDRSHKAYMLFKYTAERPDWVQSVQITGDSGTRMLPFLGLTLGATRDAVVSRFGMPSSVEHQSDVDRDLYKYKNRNYSVEIDASRRLYSIQIFGEIGFPPIEAAAPPSLDSLRAAFRRGPEATLSYLSPDVEIYRGRATIMFKHSARFDIESRSSEIAKLLFQGPNSVAAILNSPSAREESELSIRVWEQGGPPGWVLKFNRPVPIEELVFKGDAGQWRLYEIRYR